MSLTELAHLTGVSLATVQREVQRAETAGVVRSERVGPTRLVRADQSRPPPHDVDVLVVGDPERNEVYDAAERAERRLHRPVQVTFRTPEEWANEDDPFISTVRSRPLVRLHVGTLLAVVPSPASTGCDASATHSERLRPFD